MTTYLDHQPWMELMVSKPSEGDGDLPEAWLNLKRFLKRETDLVLNLPEALNYNDPNYMFYTTLTSGRGLSARIGFQPNAFRFKRKALFQNEIEDAHSFFILDAEDKEMFNSWKGKNGFIIENASTVLNEWIRLRQIITSKFPRSFSVRREAESKNNLTDLSSLKNAFQHPCTEFVLADRFLFAEKGLSLYNIENIIKSLTERKRDMIGWFFGSISETYSKDTSEIVNDISMNLKDYPDIKINVVLDDGNRYKEHDRWFITNYFCFKPGDGFCFFKMDGSYRTNGTTIEGKSLFEPSEMESTKLTLENLSKIYNASANKHIGSKKGKLIIADNK